MKTLKKVAVLIIIFGGLVSHAQTSKHQDSQHDSFHGKAAEMSFLSSQNLNTSNPNTISSNSGVFINQIGADNTSVVRTRANITDLAVTQNGDNNDLYYQVSAENIKGNLLQNGDNNSIFHTNPFNIESHQAQIIQNGNGQNIEWSGTNATSERMSIKMQGESQSVIIRSFN